MRKQWRLSSLCIAATAAVLAAAPVSAQSVDTARIDAGGQNDWLTYHGSYRSYHYSPLAQINAGNVANLGVDYVGLFAGGEYHPENGSGAMTVFERSRAEVSRCTFTGNWAGVDDNGTGSTYVKSIFWNNTLKGGISTGARYEIDITNGSGVRECFIHGETNDLRGTIDRTINTFDPPDPRFDTQFVPQEPEYEAVGYRLAAAASRGHTGR